MLTKFFNQEYQPEEMNCDRQGKMTWPKFNKCEELHLQHLQLLQLVDVQDLG